MQVKDNVAYQAYLLTKNQSQTKDTPIKNLVLDWAKRERMAGKGICFCQ